MAGAACATANGRPPCRPSTSAPCFECACKTRYNNDTRYYNSQQWLQPVCGQPHFDWVELFVSELESSEVCVIL